MNMKTSKAIVATWLRATAASVAALYLSGVTDPKQLLNAAIAGLIGPLAKALNPKDSCYGLKVK